MKYFLATVIWFTLLSPAQATDAEGQKYRLVLNISWSKATHPFEWPKDGGQSIIT